jgi:hypothetical protein
MSNTEDQTITRYVARRLNKKLLDSLMPPASDIPTLTHAIVKEETTGLGAVWEGAVKIGVGIKTIFQNLLFDKKVKPINQYKKGSSGPAFANMYGYLMVVLDKGRVRAYKDPGLQAPPKEAEVFLVADLVGLSLARISGKVSTSQLSAGRATGQFDEGLYAIDLWLDPGQTNTDGQLSPDAEERLGRFLQTFMTGRDELTLEEFCQISEQHLSPLVRRLLDLPIPQFAWQQGQVNGSGLDPVDQAIVELQNSTLKLLGVSAFVRFRPGTRVFRHQISLDENTLALSQKYAARSTVVRGFGETNWECQSCKHDNVLSNAFCEECGTPKPSAIQEASVAASGEKARRLISSDGDQLVFDLAFVSYDQQNVRTDEIASKCVEILRPICQKLPVARFGDVAVLQAIAGALNEQMSSGVLGAIGEFAVIDFRSADSDWRLQTRAHIREQMRELDGQQAQFEVADADFALRQAQRLRDLREAEHDNQIARDELAQRKTDVSLDLERQQIEARQKVDENRLFVEREVDMLRDGRVIGRETRRLDREDLKEATQADRSDQLSELDHEMGLENKVLAHDLSKEQLLAQAKLSSEELASQAKRGHTEADAALEDRIARLRAGRNLDIAGQEQALDLNKKRTEQEIELERIRLEHELQLQKLQMMSNIDIAQKEQFKGMTPAQMLAMQAKLLVEGGATDALSNLTASDAVAANAAAEAKVAQTKAEMLEKMLEMQSKSNENSTARQMEIMMAALNAQKEAAEKVDKANERTATSAERWNEKSIDAMAKVAATAAGKAGGKAEAVPASKEDSAKVACGECGAMNLKTAKFCGECGTKAN